MDSEVPGEQREPHHRRLWVAVHRFSLRIWHWVNHRTHNYILYLAQAGKNFATKGQHEAVGFAYWAIFSLFPFLVLLIIITTSVLGSRSSRTDIFSVLSQLLPQVGSTLIQDTLNKIIPQHPAFSFLSAVGLFWGARKLFTNLQASLSRIFRDEKRRPWYWEFPIGLTMMATFGGLIVLSTSLASLFRLISLRVSGPRSPFIGLEGTFALLIINMSLLMMLFRFIPQRKISWRASQAFCHKFFDKGNVKNRPFLQRFPRSVDRGFPVFWPLPPVSQILYAASQIASRRLLTRLPGRITPL